MAYMNQEKKARIATALKAVVPKDWKYSLSVRNHSTIVMTIYSAPVDLIEEANRCADEGGRTWRVNGQTFNANPYAPEHYFIESLPLIQKVLAAMNGGNHDRSDPTTDYYDVGWYVNLEVGRWDKPFVCTAPVKVAA